MVSGADSTQEFREGRARADSVRIERTSGERDIQEEKIAGSSE